MDDSIKFRQKERKFTIGFSGTMVKSLFLKSIISILIIVGINCVAFLPLGLSTERPEGVGATVAKWSMLEIAMISTRTYKNPYTDVEINALFIGPSGMKKTVKGFWDGGNTFKVRFTPVEVGTWRFSIASNPLDAGLCQSGSVEVTPAKDGRHGFLRRDPTYRRSFVFDDGSRYLMVGQTYYEILRNAWSGDSWKEAVDNCKRFGFNKIRLLLRVWNDERAPFSKIYPFFDNDFESLNTSYFQKFDRVIEYLEQSGIIADVILMSENQDGYGTLMQDLKYIRYALARYAAFTNVIWTLVNEWEYSKYGEGNEWYWNSMGGIVRNEDPWMEEMNRYRPLSIHQQTYHTFKWASSAWIVHAIIQDGVWNGHHEGPRFGNGDQWGNYGIVQNLSLEIPVVNDECGYFGQFYTYNGISSVIDRDHLRRAMWGIYIAGGYGTLGDDTGRDDWWVKARAPFKRIMGVSIKDAKPWITAVWNELPVYDDIKRLSDFWTARGIKYWQMKSRNDLVASGERVYVLGDAGREYVVYAADGGTFEISLPHGVYNISWFNPVTGESKISGRTKGSHRTGFSSPFYGDAVLHIIVD